MTLQLAPAPATEARLELLHRQEFRHLTDDEFDYYLEFCRQRRVNPWLRQVIPEIRHDAHRRRHRVEFIVTIEALRVIALATGKYLGRRGPTWCGADGAWRDVWTGDGWPIAAMVGVERKGFREPLFQVARFEAFAPMEVANGKPVPVGFWARMPDHMIAKVAEALALRAAFPDVCGGLLIAEEIERDSGRRPQSDAPGAAERGWDPLAPQTDLQFNIALAELGLGNLAKRQAVVDRYAAEYPQLAEADRPAFYKTVVQRVAADPQGHGITAAGTE